MKQGILTINAGSSSIKFALFPLAHPILSVAEVSGQIDGIGAENTELVAKNRAGKLIAEDALGHVNHDQAFDALLKWFMATHAGWAIVAVELPATRPGFRAIGTRVTALEPGIVGLSEDARRRLGIEDGQKVWLSYG